jgi:uncharacterized protein YdaU (DUF1376 family)
LTAKKEKSPAFQFYPRDWMGGAPASMVPEETHVYVWLLCKDWEDGGIVFDEKKLAHYCRLTRPRFRKAWETVKDSFVERNGRLYNPRLERERKKQAEFKEIMSKSGRVGAQKRWGNGKPSHSHPNSHPNDGAIAKPPLGQWPPIALQSSDLRSKSERSSSNSESGEAGALEGARTREQAEIEDINRRRLVRGDEPIDAL